MRGHSGAPQPQGPDPHDAGSVPSYVDEVQEVEGPLPGIEKDPAVVREIWQGRVVFTIVLFLMMTFTAVVVAIVAGWTSWEAVEEPFTWLLLVVGVYVSGYLTGGYMAGRSF